MIPLQRCMRYSADPRFLHNGPVHDLIHKAGHDQPDPHHGLHTFITAATPGSPERRVQIMMYAQKRIPLPYQNESDQNFWRSFHIEAHGPDDTYRFYTYRPRDVINHNMPIEQGGRESFSSTLVENFNRGITYFNNIRSHNDLCTLPSEDQDLLRYLLFNADYNDELAQRMIAIYKQRWPDAYDANNIPPDRSIGRQVERLRAAGQRLGETLGGILRKKT